MPCCGAFLALPCHHHMTTMYPLASGSLSRWRMMHVPRLTAVLLGHPADLLAVLTGLVTVTCI